MKLILYTGPECSLCDLAIEIVEEYNALVTNADNSDLPNINAQGTSTSANLPSKILLEKINIRTSTDLYHLYGARIPVIKDANKQTELGWPFTIDDLIEFLK